MAPRLLAVGQASQPSGFARVLRAVLGQLSGRFEVEQLALGPPAAAPWPMHASPCAGDIYGLAALPALMERFMPAVVLVLHDPWVLPAYAAALRGNTARLVAYTPLDGEPSPALGSLPALVDRLVVYTQTARLAFARVAAIRAERIAVIPHGVDTATFRSAGRTPAAPDSFTVLNANRNQPRKRLAATVEGFARFARGKPHGVRLVLHTAPQGAGCDLERLVRGAGIGRRVTITGRGREHPALGDAELNALYNRCDVGLNTSVGEGWGLVSLEHAATGAAQVVPRHSACAEVWDRCAEFVDPGPCYWPRASPIAQRPVEAGTVAAALERLYHDPARLARTARACEARARSAEFAWERIGNRWAALLEETLSAPRRRSVTDVT